ESGGANNGAVFSLVQGTFAFVAGQVAKTGDMKIDTPVATMGIRGTTGDAGEDTVATISASAGDITYYFDITRDRDGFTVGRYTLTGRDGTQLVDVGDVNIRTFVTSHPNGPPTVTQLPLGS